VAYYREGGTTPHLRLVFFFISGVQLAFTGLQENKNIKNVKRCRDGMPKSMQTR